MDFSLVAHCDWSISARKRWMAVAHREGNRWIVSPPERVGPSSSLLQRLHGGYPGNALVGFDFPIGLPEWYSRQAGFSSFRQALETVGGDGWDEWYEVASQAQEISMRRPFYPMRPGGTSRAQLLAALGAPNFDALLRQCELPSADRQAAYCLFWPLGGNQVGKGAISGWKRVLVPNLGYTGLSPFDGTLSQLATRHRFVLAETYPSDVYGQLGLPRGGWSKTRQSDRAELSKHIRAWLVARPALDATAVQLDLTSGFGADTAGEDRFDALVGLLGMLSVVTGERSEGTPVGISAMIYEGWILGHHREALRSKLPDEGRDMSSDTQALASAIRMRLLDVLRDQVKNAGDALALALSQMPPEVALGAVQSLHWPVP